MEPDELERQLELLHPGSFAWALHCCGGDHGEAEDVLQTTYLKILEGRARYRGASSLKTWLYAVIRNTAAGSYRRRARRRGLLRGSAQQPADPAHLSTPQEQLEASREKERLRCAVASLAPRQRELIELVFYHELSLREAAGVLRVSVGSARTHYDRAKRRLLRALDEDGGDE